MAGTPTTHPVLKAIHKPMLLAGVDRRLFFVVVGLSFLALNLTRSFIGCGVLFGVSISVAKLATKREPEIVPIVMRAWLQRRRYDPAKRGQPFRLEVQ
jgi:type IV secretory pathway TrbD component